MIPQKHQENAANKLQGTSGLLVTHGLGSGKTFTAIVSGEKTPNRKLVVVPSSLRANFSKELDRAKVDKSQYDIVSLEAFRNDPHRYIRPEHGLLIADEFHKARNADSVSHESFAQIRHRVPKMIGLTGSPISNHPSELVSLVNTVAGKQVFRNEEDFRKRFISEEQVSPGIVRRLLGVQPGVVERPKNLDGFKAVLAPYVHSFKATDAYMSHFPSVKREVEHVTMDAEQQKYYDFAFDRLPSWAKGKIEQNLPPSKREAKSMNTFLSAARQISNTPEVFGSQTTSPKIRAIVRDIRHGLRNDPNFKSVTYSNYVDSGLKPVARELDRHGISYGMFTGEQADSHRQQMVRDYNAGKIKHLLVSPAGAEGLDLKATKLHQIVDQHFNPEKTRQAIGRSARFRSHETLPTEERNVLVKEYLAAPQLRTLTKVKRFFGLAPKDVHEMGVDQYIRNRAKEKAELNDAFMDALNQVH